MLLLLSPSAPSSFRRVLLGFFAATWTVAFPTAPFAALFTAARSSTGGLFLSPFFFRRSSSSPSSPLSPLRLGRGVAVVVVVVVVGGVTGITGGWGGALGVFSGGDGSPPSSSSPLSSPTTSG
ncbi:hypothetical protein MTO96_036094 [Rhipicephalus appendiculatus]